MPYARHSRRRAVTVFWSYAQDQRLIELHERRALSADEIAHELCVTRRSLTYRTQELRRRGWRIPYPVRKKKSTKPTFLPRVQHRWTPDCDATLVSMRSQGKRARAIALALGVSSRAIYARAATLGIAQKRRAA